jgi:uncharacterized membrane protein (Fun14 family)
MQIIPAAIAIAGLVLLILWAKTNLKKNSLLILAIILILVGILTASLSGLKKAGHFSNKQNHFKNYQEKLTDEEKEIIKMKEVLSVE